MIPSEPTPPFPVNPAPNPAQSSAKPEDPPLPPARPLSYWVKHFLACNPFYLASAALLLYGLYRVSIDPAFLSGEITHLLFNFSSLQVYEILLVVTAIFLARRRVYYDSTLLAGLENLLVLVPFILVSQAALIDPRIVWGMCLAGGALALGRFAGLKRFLPKLNLPARLLSVGSLLLAVNVALPVLYRVLHENKVGTKPTSGAAYLANEYCWLLLLPLLCALANRLPPLRSAHSELPGRGWLPAGFFALWLTGTGVHLYCLGYVYDFNLRPELLAPALWVLFWTAFWQSPAWLPRLTARPAGLMVPPLLVTFLAATGPGKEVFLMLTLLNLAFYASAWLCRKERRLIAALLLVSAAALIAGFPEDWGRQINTGFSRDLSVGAAIAFGLLLWTSVSRDSRAGLVGAVTVLVTGLVLAGKSGAVPQWPFQACLVFLLLHSLRWDDAAQAAAVALRRVAAVAWVAHVWLWLHLGAPGWLAAAIGGAVLGLCTLVWWITSLRPPAVLLAAAAAVIVAGPTGFLLQQVRTAPTGVLAIAGSFLLFALGTAAALTRQHWSHLPEESDQSSR